MALVQARQGSVIQEQETGWWLPRTALASAALLLLLAACGGPQRGDPAGSLSLQAQRLCRERMAELPAGLDRRQSRQAYARCLHRFERERFVRLRAPGALVTKP